MKTPIEELHEILKGIDKCETTDSDGWWETSTGAKFGADMLKQVVNLFEAHREKYKHTKEDVINFTLGSYREFKNHTEKKGFCFMETVKQYYTTEHEQVTEQ